MEQLQSILTDLDNKAITKHQAYDLILVLSDVSRSQICINIPKGIKSHMDKLGIPENNQSQLFKEYIDFLLGVNYGMEVDSFMTWTEEEDNITDFKDYC